MQAIKTKTDQLAALGKPLNHENLIEKILKGLDDDYQLVVDTIKGRDAPISFDELQEKLINKELFLRQKNNSLPLPIIANTRSNGINNKNHLPRLSWNPSQGLIGNFQSTNRDGRSTPRPFLGHCQWCRTQGHVVSQSPIFKQQNLTMQPPLPRSNNHWQSPQPCPSSPTNP